MYLQNTCFYYNRCFFEVKGLLYILNSEGSCLMNSLDFYKILPLSSKSVKMFVTEESIGKLDIEGEMVRLKIPIVKERENVYRIDGRKYIKKDISLIYYGKTILYEKYVDKRKNKKG